MNKAQWFFVCYLILSLNLVGCKTKPTSSNLTTPVGVPVSRQPDWLMVKFPEPGSIISLSNSDPSHISDSEVQVCFVILPQTLLQPSDFWKLEDVLNKTTVIIDSKEKNIVSNSARDGGVLLTFSDSGDFGTSQDPSVLENLDRTIIAQSSGPFSWCVSMEPEIGTHTVLLQFLKSSGEIVEYSWSFSIVQGDLPTPTPLPKIEPSSNLPDYLPAVFPMPNTVSINFENSRDWVYFLPSQQMPGVWPQNGEHPICVAVDFAQLHQFGQLPQDEWKRMYLTVDDTRYDWELSFDHGINGGYSICILFPFLPGQHTASLYIDFFDTQMLSYSWSFKLESAQ